MSDLITLEMVDVDGAVREAAEEAGATRSQFIKRTGMAGAGLAAGGVLFSGLASPAEASHLISSRPSRKNDVKILNYALTLEFLEAEFYRLAIANRNINQPQVKTFVNVVYAHEQAHVKFLRAALGSAAIKKPRFDFGSTVTNEAEFKATSQVLEDTGVMAYSGQGPNISQRAVVKAALSILAVEARHAAWIRFINSGGINPTPAGRLPAPRTFDSAASQRAVLAAVKKTGFIKG